MSKHEENVQEPLVRIGTGLDVCGCKATVTGFSKHGVLCRFTGSTENLCIEFQQIENALFGKHAAR